MNRRIIVITGPTCGGKTALKDRLLKAFPAQFVGVTTTTSRAPRVGEVSDKDYLFVSKKQFEVMLDKQAFLEAVNIKGYYYGTERGRMEDALETGKDIVLVVDPDGVRALESWAKESDVRIVRVLASAPIDELRNRLRRRAGIAARDEVIERFAGIEDEVAKASSIGRFDHVVGANGDASLIEVLSQ